MLTEHRRGQRGLVLAGALGGIIGTALALNGATALRSLLIVTQDAAPYLLIATALAFVVRVLNPPRLIVFPALLIALGLALLAQRHNWWGDLDLPSLWLVLAVAGVVLATFAVPLHDDLSGAAVRCRTICWPRSYRCRDTAPAYIHLTATLAQSVIDLTSADHAHSQIIEVFVRRWGGRVELRVPAQWLILVGRVTPVSTGLMPVGDVDSTKVYRDPADKDRNAIEKLLEKSDAANSGAPPRVAVVVHVLGIGGSVRTIKGAPIL